MYTLIQTLVYLDQLLDFHYTIWHKYTHLVSFKTMTFWCVSISLKNQWCLMLVKKIINNNYFWYNVREYLGYFPIGITLYINCNIIQNIYEETVTKSLTSRHKVISSHLKLCNSLCICSDALYITYCLLAPNLTLTPYIV